MSASYTAPEIAPEVVERYTAQGRTPVALDPFMVDGRVVVECLGGYTTEGRAGIKLFRDLGDGRYFWVWHRTAGEVVAAVVDDGLQSFGGYTASQASSPVRYGDWRACRDAGLVFGRQMADNVSCPTCGSDDSPCVDCNPIPTVEAAELALEARAVLLDEQAARDAEAEQLIVEMRELDARASDLERRAGEAVRRREHEQGRMLQAEAWALADRYYQRRARLGVLGYAVTRSLELERLPSPAPAFDGCVRCIAPAALTIRFSGGDLVRLCTPCFERHYQRNEYLAVAWEVVESEPAPAQDLPISAGARVEVAFGPDQGQPGTVICSINPAGYYTVRLDRPGPWPAYYYLPEEVRRSTVPPPAERPWANDAAYSALG